VTLGAVVAVSYIDSTLPGTNFLPASNGDLLIRRCVERGPARCRPWRVLTP
jgi:hypothetical protein